MLIKEELEKLYKTGLSLDKIAEKKNLSRADVQYWMEKYNISKRLRFESGFLGYWGINKNQPPPKNITTENIKELYFKNGLSAGDIAKLFNRSTGAVYRLKKEGARR